MRDSAAAHPDGHRGNVMFQAAFGPPGDVFMAGLAKYKKTTDPVDQNRLMNEMEEINKLQDKIYSEFGDVLVVKKFDVNKNKIDFLGEPKGSLDPGGTLFGDKFLQDFTLEDTVLLDVSRNMRKFGPDGEILYKAKRDIDVFTAIHFCLTKRS